MDNNILESMYIGDINKSHKGGYKIISSAKDDYITKKRNFILNELTHIFNGGKQLMYEDIPQYIQALEGKYLRNKIRGGDSINSDKIKGYYKKLVKKSLKDFTGGNDLLNIIKKNSPFLSTKIDKHIDKYKLNGGLGEYGIKNFIVSKNFDLETFENSISTIENMYLQNKLLCGNKNDEYTKQLCTDNSKYIKLYNQLKNFAQENWKTSTCPKKQYTSVCQSVDEVIKNIAPTIHNDMLSFRGSSNKSLHSYYTQAGGDLNCTSTCKLDKKSEKINHNIKGGHINSIRGGIWNLEKDTETNEYYYFNPETGESKWVRKYKLIDPNYKYNENNASFIYDFFNRVEEYYSGNPDTSRWLDPSSKQFTNIIKSFIYNNLMWVGDNGIEERGNNIKNWLLDNFQYANTLPQIFFVIMALEAEYVQLQKEFETNYFPDLIKLSISVIRYFSCSSWLDNSRSEISYNFRKYAPTLTSQNPFIEQEVTKLRQQVNDDFCDNPMYIADPRGGYQYGGNSLDQLRQEINEIRGFII